MIENYTMRKRIFTILNNIYYRTWLIYGQDRSDEFYNLNKPYIDMAIELGFLDAKDWKTVTKDGLFQMDNAYVIGRISFVLLIKRLLKMSHARLISLISRGINIALHPSNEEMDGSNKIVQGIVEQITLPNLLRMKRIIDKRIQTMNSTSILDETFEVISPAEDKADYE